MGIGPVHDLVTWFQIPHAGEQVAQCDFKTKQLIHNVPVDLDLPLFWKSHFLSADENRNIDIGAI